MVFFFVTFLDCMFLNGGANALRGMVGRLELGVEMDTAGDADEDPMDEEVVVNDVELHTEVVVVVPVLDEEVVAGGDGVVPVIDEQAVVAGDGVGVDKVEEDTSKNSDTDGTKDVGPLVVFPVKVGIPDLIRSEVRLLRKVDVEVWTGSVV